MSWSEGKTVVITGGNAGIGLATAIGMVRDEYNVVLAVRNQSKGEAARKEILAAVPGSDPSGVAVTSLDLASLASIRTAAKTIPDTFGAISVLINNAGVVMLKRSTTSDGFEMTFGVNHLGHFLLTNLLREPLVAGSPARVVVVASDAHKGARKGLDFDDLMAERRYNVWSAYAKSKLANILFTRELSRRWQGTGVTVNSVHPGFVATRLARDGDGGRLGDLVMGLIRPFAKTPEQGAKTSIHVATAPDLVDVTGEYFADSKIATPTAAGRDDLAAARLWDVSSKLVGWGD
jgi:NAD(P)-dependent dehydrogenase (short-subunit alcohol dehydrogenase family)